MYEGGDLFHYALSRIFSDVEGQVFEEESGKSVSIHSPALLVAGGISTGEEAVHEMKSVESIARRRTRGMVRRLESGPSRQLKARAAARTEKAAHFVYIDPHSIRGSAEIPVTSLLGRTLSVEWEADDSDAGDVEDEEEEGEEEKEKKKQVEEKSTARTEREKKAESPPGETVAFAVIGGSLHTPRVEQYVREQVRPSVHHVSAKEEGGVFEDERQPSASSSSSSYVASLVCLFRAEEEKVRSQGGQHFGVGGGEGSRGGDDQEKAAGLRQEKEKTKKGQEAGDAFEHEVQTPPTQRPLANLSPGVQASDALIQEIAGYLRLTYVIYGEPLTGEQPRPGKEESEDGKGDDEGFLKGRTQMHAELCGISMAASTARTFLTLKVSSK